MSRTTMPDMAGGDGLVPGGDGPVARAYDAVARGYDAQLRDELEGKPMDRALLAGFVELAGAGVLADLGCGPGHVTRFLAARHPEVVGVDLSARMIEIARERAPELTFTVGSMLRLPVADAAWSGAVALYSIIHLTAPDRAVACREFARAVRPGGWLLVAFHVDGPGTAAGGMTHLTEWFGESVDLDVRFLDPADVSRSLEGAGFRIMSTTVRQPLAGVEYPSRRCYLLAQQVRGG